MSIHFLAFDLDGTLLTDDKTIDSRTKESIQKAINQGMHIIIASGRDKSGCQFVYEPLGLENGNHFLALVNGQIIYDFKNKEYDLDHVLTPEDGLKIQKVCKEFDVEGIFQCGYDFYSYVSKANRFKKKIRNWMYGEQMDYGLKNGENRNFIDLPFEEIRITKDINKVIMIHTKKFFEKNLEKLKAALQDYDVLLIGSNWLEVMPKGVNKASAIQKIAKSLGYSMNEVMAFGDAQNDIEMIQQAGIGVAMKNGMKEVKEVATLITDTNNNNNNNGIGKVIDALLEGKEIDLRAGRM